jgi:hypothetical protein
VALDPEHRLVISAIPGARTIENTEALVADFRRRTEGRLMNLMTSDDYPAAGDGQEDPGPGDLDGRGSLEAADPSQLARLFVGQLAERVLRAARQGGLLMRGRPSYVRHSIMAMRMPPDPLALRSRQEIGPQQLCRVLAEQPTKL